MTVHGGGTVASTAEATVVIPWAGPFDLLAEQLDALSAQVAPKPLDVIVCINTASALAVRDDRAVLARWPGVRWEDATQVPGPGHARNIGWRAARTPLVLFCDADDVAASRWAGALVAALGSVDVVRGELEYARLNVVPFQMSRLPPGVHPTSFDHLPFGPTSCLGVRRTVLEAIDGFDEALLMAEDIDLCWRAQDLGFTFGSTPDAVMHYRLRQRFLEVLRQGLRYGDHDADLFQKHRDRGLTRPITSSIRSVAALVLLAVQAATGAPARLQLAFRLGTVLGRVRGSIRRRVWIV